ncbi:DUF4974 domain-containing protein [Sphingobacterium sp. DK4209]|uniref:DUF4974 domain-containing protein n=1 Tax=Sphingobacterium zhuxiongii TaxID=2662364 RepID=A0A5Q0QHN2_9SPHI|nr:MULTISPECIES: FecR family protein [unclassified Sphingobacterium]MVZ64611.1 DUF4974 domain-containing protein [Sphingobacterium sp. DK4209]QGA26950.1 DUF4974 domain-containing protein [Sphingobacterium sp. dk4302]
MSNQRLISLFDRYMSSHLSKTELEEFLTLLDDCDEAEFDFLVESHLEEIQLRKAQSEAYEKEAILTTILDQIENKKERESLLTKFSLKWLAGTAAAIVLFLGFYLFYARQESSVRSLQVISKNDIKLQDEALPTIQRTDGKTFQIEQSTGDSLKEEGLYITKDENGNRLFKLSKVPSAVSESRTFISPKGSSLQLELEDGTRVWLNSGASVTYPASFAANQREIAIAGEAFLDVSPNKQRPFIVHANKTQIKVLGTQFNIQSKKESSRVETTLVEGSVEVQAGDTKRTLKPGFRSISTDHSSGIAIQQADLKSILAWKEGYFRFDDDQIEVVIAKISEWYDIGKVDYARHSDEEFSGMIKRTKSLKELLIQIEKISTYKFKIQDGRVLVM